MIDKVNSLKRNDLCYPEALNEIASPPKELFWTGVDPSAWMGKPKVTIVGSRKATAYGREVTRRLTTELCDYGVVIISGLAYGIDYEAHKATLDAGGITVAVLPTSLDKIYPAAHQHLAGQIIKRGSLLSEYAKGSDVYKQNFVARNRIETGLADLVLITEASSQSGTIHTANFALEQGKTVMAVPGNINSPTSEGTNNLIKTGAMPVTCVEDILFELKIDTNKAKQKSVFRGSKQEELILSLITKGIHNQEEISIRAALDSPSVSGALTMLELSGQIRPTGSGQWILS